MRIVVIIRLFWHPAPVLTQNRPPSVSVADAHGVDPYAHLSADREPGVIAVVEHRLSEDGTWTTALLPDGAHG